MRIIGGRYRRSLLKGPPDGSLALRPTGDMVRESVFNLLGARVDGANFLDLFAGTGAVGIEALSRGARRVVFVDNNPVSLGIIRENVEKIGLPGSCAIVRKDAIAYTASQSGESFDIVYADPPYDSDLMPAILRNLGGGTILRDGAMVFTEHRRLPDIEREGMLVRADARKYGKTWIAVWEKNMAGEL